MTIDHGPAHGRSRPAVFIGKDGTLVVDVPDNVEPARLRFTTGAADGLRRLQDAGFALVVVTHEPGIAQQRVTRRDFARLEAALFARLAEQGIRLDGLHLCAHGPLGQRPGSCLCKAPAPGLLRQAAVAHDIDLSRSWMIGDTLDDVEAGHRAGCRSVLLDVGNETGWRRSPLREPDHRCADLLAAAKHILEQSRPPYDAHGDADAHNAVPLPLAGTGLQGGRARVAWRSLRELFLSQRLQQPTLAREPRP